ncbi:phosphomevalonate kinase [Clarias magur]|uniref:Phosphomevalonate kinase n=1 Tax=Clarias magur TaxID=1594786 RepID=A0A8J4X2Q2_CLAMG|nr:phosphomevalonate kinase [Clarias magur]
MCRLSPELCCILRLSAPLKEQYAKEHGLDYTQLLGAGQYKEHHRAKMIRWGESRRNQDPGFFCRIAVCGASQPVWGCHVTVVANANYLSQCKYVQSLTFGYSGGNSGWAQET